MFGYSFDGQRYTHETFAIGSEVHMHGKLKLVGELRWFDWVVRDDLYEVLTIGMRYLGDHVGVEAGLARWLEDGVELRPTVSLAYRY